jgi:hypothetical protein
MNSIIKTALRKVFRENKPTIVDRYNIRGFDTSIDSCNINYVYNEYLDEVIEATKGLVVEYDDQLELHSNHTLWSIDEVPKEYGNIRHEYMYEFEEQTGVTLELLGRSGRHVCVECNLTNILDYVKLKKLALKLEEKLINYCNSGDWR